MAGDKFYTKYDSQRIEWVYFNPDSNEGGQYVYNMLNAHIIEKAAGLSAEDFFDRIGSNCVQYLVDVNTFGFEEADYHFKNAPCDFEDCTEETMAALIALSSEWQRDNCNSLSTFGPIREGEYWHFNCGLAVVNYSDKVFTIYFNDGVDPHSVISQPYELSYVSEIDGYRLSNYHGSRRTPEVLRQNELKPVDEVYKVEFQSPNLWEFDKAIVKHFRGQTSAIEGQEDDEDEYEP